MLARVSRGGGGVGAGVGAGDSDVSAKKIVCFHVQCASSG